MPASVIGARKSAPRSVPKFLSVGGELPQPSPSAATSSAAAALQTSRARADRDISPTVASVAPPRNLVARKIARGVACAAVIVPGCSSPAREGVWSCSSWLATAACAATRAAAENAGRRRRRGRGQAPGTDGHSARHAVAGGDGASLSDGHGLGRLVRAPAGQRREAGRLGGAHPDDPSRACATCCCRRRASRPRWRPTSIRRAPAARPWSRSTTRGRSGVVLAIPARGPAEAERLIAALGKPVMIGGPLTKLAEHRRQVAGLGLPRGARGGHGRRGRRHGARDDAGAGGAARQRRRRHHDDLSRRRWRARTGRTSRAPSPRSSSRCASCRAGADVVHDARTATSTRPSGRCWAWSGTPSGSRSGWRSIRRAGSSCGRASWPARGRCWRRRRARCVRSRLTGRSWAARARR